MGPRRTAPICKSLPSAGEERHAWDGDRNGKKRNSTLAGIEQRALSPLISSLQELPREEGLLIVLLASVCRMDVHLGTHIRHSCVRLSSFRYFQACGFSVPPPLPPPSTCHEVMTFSFSLSLSHLPTKYANNRDGKSAWDAPLKASVVNLKGACMLTWRTTTPISLGGGASWTYMVLAPQNIHDEAKPYYPIKPSGFELEFGSGWNLTERKNTISLPACHFFQHFGFL